MARILKLPEYKTFKPKENQPVDELDEALETESLEDPATEPESASIDYDDIETDDDNDDFSDIEPPDDKEDSDDEEDEKDTDEWDEWDENEFQPEDLKPLSTVAESETPLSEAENILIKISNAALIVRSREAQVEQCKSDLKEAKEALEKAQEKLQVISEEATNYRRGGELDKERPLLNIAEGSQPAATTVEGEPADESWREVSISVLWMTDPIQGLGTAKQEALVDEVGTLGKFQTILESVGKDADTLAKLLPRGIGEAMADELENRHLLFVAKFGNATEVTKVNEQQPEEILGVPVIVVSSDDDASKHKIVGVLKIEECPSIAQSMIDANQESYEDCFPEPIDATVDEIINSTVDESASNPELFNLDDL